MSRACACVYLVKTYRSLGLEIDADDYSVLGKLGEVVVTRQSSYFVVCGKFPLDFCAGIYALGRLDLRAGGHCANPHPESQVTWYASGKVVANPAEEPIFRRLGLRYDHLVFGDPQMLTAEPFVMLYHIDTIQGLSLFLDQWRLRNLERPTGVSRGAGSLSSISTVKEET
jgi:hypothetical protein